MGPKQALKAVPKKNNKPNQNKANKNFTYLLTHVLVCWGPSTICLYMMYAPISWPCKQGPPSETIWTNPMKTIMVWHCWIPPQLWVNLMICNEHYYNRWVFYRPLLRGQWWFIIPSQTSILSEWARKGHDFLRQFATWSMSLGHRK